LFRGIHVGERFAEPHTIQDVIIIIITADSARTSPAPAPTVKQSRKQFQSIDSDWLVRFDDAYTREVDAWAKSVAMGQPTGPSVWDSYVAMVVADACVLSAKTGQPQTVSDLERPSMYVRQNGGGVPLANRIHTVQSRRMNPIRQTA
jgi:predicted dehydrogenase